MTKLLLSITWSFFFSLAAYANECIDGRTADFAPCNQNEKRVYLQGACTKPYQAESTYCSPLNSTQNCIDVRGADFGPCSYGQKRIYIQGKCRRNYEIEHTYCAKR
ncbi:MAG: hypothetical protein AAGB31_16065 [Bdellovibrio sp.]